MKKLYFLFSLLMATVIGLSSCESDDSLTNEPPAQEYIDKAKEILVGDLVLSTRATMSGVDKTLLESGCPTKFNFFLAGRRHDGARPERLHRGRHALRHHLPLCNEVLCNSTVGKR